MKTRDDDATTPATPRATAASVLAAERAALPQRYRVIDRLGAGGMGRVLRAHDTVLGREVAIKLVDEAIRRDPALRARFVREAPPVARLDHPNIVRVHDADEDAGWLVMELAPGQTLREVLARGPLPVADGLLAALAAAHAADVVHRD